METSKTIKDKYKDEIKDRLQTLEAKKQKILDEIKEYEYLLNVMQQ